MRRLSTFAAAPAALTALALVVFAATGVEASLAARGLFADGAFYLLSVMGQEGFAFIEPARRLTQFLQQVGAVAALTAGVSDPFALGQGLSAGMLLVPVALLAAQWLALPAARKDWILAPLLTYACLMAPSTLAGIGEGAIATMAGWLLFFLVAHPSGAARAVVTALLAVGAPFLHELLAPMLLASAIMALLVAYEAETARGRAIALGLALVILGAAAAQVFVGLIAPRSAETRLLFLLSQLTGLFLFDWHAINGALAAGLLGGGALVWLVGARAFGRGLGAHEGVVVAVALAGLALIGLFLFDPLRSLSPLSAFAARSLSLPASALLAFLLLGAHLTRRSPGDYLPRPALAIIAALILTQGLAQTLTTRAWSAHVERLRAVLASHAGPLSFEAALATLAPRDRPHFAGFTFFWTAPMQSLVLSPGGRVRTILAAPAGQSWAPYKPTEPATIPRPKGLDFREFDAAFAARRP